jgi:hypothetical protein
MLDNLKKLEDSGKVGGSDFFKPTEGNNIVRVLTEGHYNESEYTDKKTGKVSITKKFVMFIIDRKDGKVKPYFAPYTVYKQIAQLETDPFFAFAGMPMPYDVNVKTANAGTMNAEYSVQASPNKVELTAEEVAAAREKGSIADYVKGLNEQDAEAHRPTPAEIVAKASGNRIAAAPSDDFFNGLEE